MSDFDNFIRHADFGKILELAGALKDQQAKLAAICQGQLDQQGHHHATAPRTPVPSRKRAKKEGTEAASPFGTEGEAPYPARQHHQACVKPDPSSFDAAAELIRAALIPSSTEGFESKVGVLKRGKCVITDSLVDETIRGLCDELRSCLDMKKQLRDRKPPSRTSEAGSRDQDIDSMDLDALAVKIAASRKGERKAATKKSNPVRDKFSKAQTDILTNWMIKNRVGDIVLGINHVVDASPEPIPTLLCALCHRSFHIQQPIKSRISQEPLGSPKCRL